MKEQTETTQTVNINLPRRGSSLGIASLVLGVVAFSICWVPLIGMLSIPLSAIGLLMGVAGIIIALTRKGSGIGFPIGGSLICAIALGATITMTAAIVEGVDAANEAMLEKYNEDNQTNQETLTTIPNKITRETTNATSNKTSSETAIQSDNQNPVNNINLIEDAETDANNLSDNITHNNESVPNNSNELNSKTEEQKDLSIDAEWAPANLPVKQDGIQIRVKSAIVNKVSLESPILDKPYITDNESLTITIEIKNLSETRKLEYRTLAGASFQLERDFATLEDNFSNSYKRINFGSASSPQGRTNNDSIYPGKTLSDVLIFQPPIKAIEYLNLEMPAKNFGGSGMIRFQINANMIVWPNSQVNKIDDIPSSVSNVNKTQIAEVATHGQTNASDEKLDDSENTDKKTTAQADEKPKKLSEIIMETIAENPYQPVSVILMGKDYDALTQQFVFKLLMSSDDSYGVEGFKGNMIFEDRNRKHIATFPVSISRNLPHKKSQATAILRAPYDGQSIDHLRLRGMSTSDYTMKFRINTMIYKGGVVMSYPPK